jgi:hypothetical protein
MLYLLKSSTTNQYLQENLQILALPMGGRSTISYASRWVAPELWGEVRRGEDVCLVLAERPYQRFIPVRKGRIFEAVDEAGDLTLDVEWGALVQEPFVAAFSKRFRQLNHGSLFVLADPNSPLRYASGEDAMREAWHRLIQELRVPPVGGRVSQYAESLFLRSLHLLDVDGEVVNGEELRPHRSYRQCLDYDVPPGKEPAAYRVIADPGISTMRPLDPIPLPQRGELLELEIHPLGPGDVEMKVWVTPDRARSTSLALEYAVLEPEEKEPFIWPPIALEGGASEVRAPVSHISDAGLRSLFEVLEMEEGEGRLQALLGLIDHTLLSLAPASKFLEEERGLILYQLGRWDEAYRQFMGLDRDLVRPETIAAWFVSACRAGVDANLGEMLHHFTAWGKEELVDSLIQVLPSVKEDRRLQLLEDAWLGSGRYAEMWETVKDTFTQPPFILRAARLMVDEDLYNLLSPAQGANYVTDRLGGVQEMSSEMLEQVVVWGREDPKSFSGLQDALVELIERQLQAGEVWHTQEMVEQLRGLSPHAWSVVAERLAEALIEKGEQGSACQLFVELARFSREHQGEIDLAGEHLSRASMLVGKNDVLQAMVDAEREEWETAVAQLEPIQKWMEGLNDVKLKRLRERLHKKSALFVGGINRGFDAEEVRLALGLEDVDFVPHFHSERGSLDKVRNRIKQGKVDYLVDFVSFGAHRNLKDDCTASGVTYVKVKNSSSLHQIVRGFARALSVELDE